MTHGMDMMGGMGGAMWVGMVLFVLLLAALIGLVIAGTIRLVRGGQPEPSTASSDLDLRYAHGELDRDEYLQRRRDLENRR